jgi:poly-gamma-glutamate synthesis protein (capsule biosynthesis protein)
MTRRGALLGLVALACAVAQGQTDGSAAAPAYRLVFAGDILLSRVTAQEIAARHDLSPWIGLADELAGADLLMGNLEGAVGDPSLCRAPPELCFAHDGRFLPLLRAAGFTAAGIANNHSGDLGEEGRRQTREALSAAGVVPIGAPESPAFVRLGEHTVALVALSLVPARDGTLDAVPSWQIAQKLRLGRALADWTVVFVHWGKELADWTVPEQQAQARWLIAQGADVIIGAHPHVVQPSACIDGRPVYFSLGNDVFDQKYLETKRGLLADCRIAGDRLSCGAIATVTPQGSSYPRSAGKIEPAGLAGCAVLARQPISAAGWTLRAWTPQGEVRAGQTVLEGMSASGHWRTRAGGLVGAELGTLAPGGPPLLLTLERHPSSMDTEGQGLRPYVYELGDTGLVARWRGSALAWPLLDARLMRGGDGLTYLCALHRGDSFLVPATQSPAPPHVLVYAWNGFGFSGRDEPVNMALCRELFVQALAP